MIYFGLFDAGLIFVVFTSIILALYAAGKKQGRVVRAPTTKEPYACGETYKKWGAHDERLYERLYRTLKIKKLDLLHNNDLDEYLAWMFMAVIATLIILSLGVN